MGILDPERAMQALEDGTIDKVNSFFPLEGKKHRLVAKRIYAGKDVDIDDITSQKQARLRGKTWATGIYGDFDLVDTDTGKSVDSVKRMKVLSLPKITRRFSYIVEGTEYQSDHQWRLKSGVYTRRKANGELESQFNLAKGRGFRLQFNPEKQTFLMGYGTSNIQLLPILQALGVKDSDIEAAWGKEIYAHNVGIKKRGEVQKLAKVLDKNAVITSDEEAAEVVRNVLSETELRKDTTEITLGAPYDKVGGPSLMATSSKLLGANRGTHKLDNRDSLRFKELWSIEDHIPERITNSSRRINYKLNNNIDRKTSIRAIVSSDIFNIPVKSFFTSTTLTQQGSQVNPIDMFGGFLRTTILGPGAISSEQSVSDEAKMVDSSFLGFVDPVHTPEGAKTGVTSHLSLGIAKEGKEATIQVFDMESKSYVRRNPSELVGKAVAFPDQYDFTNADKPSPRDDKVIVINEDGGDPTTVSPDEVDYILQSPKQLFSMTANLIPFLPSDQANRAGMATRQMEQAIGLKHREEPLVQVVSGHPSKSANTWDKIIGKLNSFRSPEAGVVESVSAQKIVVRGKDGERLVVPIYDNFPLNDKKAFITSTSLVKKGDTVRKGQTIADTNFTKNGVYAPGVNLRVGYVPFKGLVFEDGIVISESASETLTSEHLHKNRAYIEKNMAVGLRKFRANYPGVISDDNATKLDEDGVIKKGQKLLPAKL
jgi:DNA-directed RNA polymerase beta subunit